MASEVTNTNFGFRPHFDDMFDDDDFGPHLRARMRRDPFAAFGGRKRCGFMPFDDPYRHYFTDQSDLFPDFHDPEWETMRSGRRRNAPQSGGATSNARGNIFDHIPAEFRNYIPENFGFHQPATGQEYSQSYPPQQQQPQQQHPQSQPQQHYQGYVEQPQQQQYYQQPKQAPRPKFCDASIQTDHDIDAENQNVHLNPNLNQHNLRNTMDLGQKSPQEASTENYPDDGHAAFYASTGTDPQTPQQYVGQPMPDVYQQRQQAQHPPPPPQRQHVPPQYQNLPQNSQYSQHQQPASRGPQPTQNDGGFVRHVPIFIEGRSEPVRHPPPPQQHQHPQQQQQYYQPQQQYQQPQQAPRMAPQEHHQPQGPHHERPTPLNTQQAQAQGQVYPQNNNQVPVGGQDQVPQTPHTAECITKIQAIQRDVLNLLSQVEQFTGKKQDREYLYLDEMLTRNLLKLDTIDTDGKDSIRLARREAIKCIQASINVLEAKAEENAKTAQASVMEAQKPESIESEPSVIALPCSEGQLSAADADAQSIAEQQQQLSTERNIDSNIVPPASEINQSDSISEPPKVDKQEDSNETAKDTAENTQKLETTETEEQTTANEPEPCQQPETPAEESTEQLKKPTVVSEIDITLQSPPQDEATSLEPASEQIEKSSSEKENKPPGSPKKKIIRKVKKVAADKKAASPVSDTIPDESQKQETPTETSDPSDTK